VGLQEPPSAFLSYNSFALTILHVPLLLRFPYEKDIAKNLLTGVPLGHVWSVLENTGQNNICKRFTIDSCHCQLVTNSGVASTISNLQVHEVSNAVGVGTMEKFANEIKSLESRL